MHTHFFLLRWQLQVGGTSASERYPYTGSLACCRARFSKDQGIADDFLPQVLFDALQYVFMILGAPPFLAAI